MQQTTYHTQALREQVAAVLPHVTELRRTLHRFPELSEHEEATSRRIAAELDAIGIPHTDQIAGHGIVAVIPGRRTDRGVGIRADIDALPLTEKAEVPFRSQNPGVMHACGHDIHTAVLLGTARVLWSMRDQLPGAVSLFFQPAEETIGGAEAMIRAGCLQNPRVTSVIGLHVAPDLPAGSVELIAGVMNAAASEFTVTVTGKTCHGAHPTEGIDALLPACAMIGSLQSVITHSTEPTDAALLTVGTFHSGSKGNIISGEAVFSGIIRVLRQETRARIKARVAALCEATARAYGASCQVDFSDGYPVLENDAHLLAWVREAAEDILGQEQVLLHRKASMGTDDFAYFCHSGRGLYFNLGTARPDDPAPAPLHSDWFYPDEGCLRVGILTEVAATLKILAEESPTWDPA